MTRTMRVEQAARRYHAAPSPAKLQALVTAMEPLLDKWLRCDITSPEWADGEVLQAGRVRLLKLTGTWSLNGSAQFISFVRRGIIGAMRNEALDVQKLRLAMDRRQVSFDELPTEWPGVEATGDNAHALRITAQQMLSKLPDTLRIITRMYFIEGYTVEEIAAVGDFTPEAVEQLIQQATVRLQTQGAGS